MGGVVIYDSVISHLLNAILAVYYRHVKSITKSGKVELQKLHKLYKANSNYGSVDLGAELLQF